MSSWEFSQQHQDPVLPLSYVNQGWAYWIATDTDHQQCSLTRANGKQQHRSIKHHNHSERNRMPLFWEGKKGRRERERERERDRRKSRRKSNVCRPIDNNEKCLIVVVFVLLDLCPSSCSMHRHSNEIKNGRDTNTMKRERRRRQGRGIIRVLDAEDLLVSLFLSSICYDIGFYWCFNCLLPRLSSSLSTSSVSR